MQLSWTIDYNEIIGTRKFKYEAIVQYILTITTFEHSTFEYLSTDIPITIIQLIISPIHLSS